MNMTNNEQESPENSQELSEEELEQQRIQLEEYYAEIRSSPHKITPEELEEFNREDPNQEAITLEMQKNQLINLRKKYLNDTDWYLIREADQPQSYPSDVKNKRIQAREEINLIQSLSNLQQLEQFSSNF
jgi:hypothetical protein